MGRLTNHFNHCDFIGCGWLEENVCRVFGTDTEKCHRKSVYEKLREYEDAEEQGLLLRLPCPIGTTVYFVEKRCNADSAACYGGCEKCADYSISSTTFDFDMISHVGNFYFLTKEEAETALAKMKEGV